MSPKSRLLFDYICRVRYRNVLPPVPFAPKILTVPSLAERPVPYRSTSLVEQRPCSLIKNQVTSISSYKTFAEFLDAMDTNPEEEPRERSDAKGINTQKPNVTWLRRSKYITKETRGVSNRKEGVESKFAMSETSANRHNYSTLKEQLAGLENTFKPLPTNLQHPQTKSRAEKIIPLLPDMECRENICTVGRMESNASKRCRISDLDGTESGILRPMVDPHDPEDIYLAWFLPDDKITTRLKKEKEKRMERLSDEPLIYNVGCDYDFKNYAGSGSKRLLISTHNGNSGERAVYSAIANKIVVRKRKAQAVFHVKCGLKVERNFFLFSLRNINNIPVCTKGMVWGKL
ncbi:hypothetical protein INT47_006866 [Mucor saturninus]|uniref:Uncharacterized protein n=1 Tax=Mucor saturninus TaxID=64648 RepID=A0A8H7RD20_9FUNG|nr:hypothetical protein INT47_006866 [Mucor saturninus]